MEDWKAKAQKLFLKANSSSWNFCVYHLTCVRGTAQLLKGLAAFYLPSTLGFFDLVGCLSEANDGRMRRSLQFHNVISLGPLYLPDLLNLHFSLSPVQKLQCSCEYTAILSKLT